MSAAILAAGYLLVVSGSALAWLNRGAFRARRPRRTKPMKLRAILAELDADVAEARTQALDRL